MGGRTVVADVDGELLAGVVHVAGGHQGVANDFHRLFIGRGGWVGGWVGDWGDRWVEEIKAVGMSYCKLWVGWVGGWVRDVAGGPPGCRE